MNNIYEGDESLTRTDKTGEVFIQFDNEEEEKFADFFGNGNLEITLGLPPKEEREANWIAPEIKFISKTGKTMRLFIKEV